VTFPDPPRRVIVQPRLRVPRAANQIQGIGSFEIDSDGDGLPDGWMKSSQSFSPTLTLEADPQHVLEGFKSLKVVCASGSDLPHIKTAIRGNFQAGQTYRASIQVKTSGTLTGVSPFLRLRTERFNTGQEIGSPASTGLTLGSFTPFQSDITLTRNTNLLEFRFDFNNAAGTLWLDDAQLYRI